MSYLVNTEQEEENESVDVLNPLVLLKEFTERLKDKNLSISSMTLGSKIPCVFYEEFDDDVPPSQRTLYTSKSRSEVFYLDENIIIHAFRFMHRQLGYRSFLSFDDLNNKKVPTEEELSAYFEANPHKFLDEEFSYFVKFPEQMREDEPFFDNADLNISSTLYYLNEEVKYLANCKVPEEFHFVFGTIGEVHYVSFYSEETSYFVFYTNPYLIGFH